MIHHLLRFETEMSAVVALHSYRCVEEGIDTWNTLSTIPNQKIIITREEVAQNKNGDLVVKTPEVCVPGFFITITKTKLDEVLRDLPDGVCRIITDGVSGEILYAALDMDFEMLSTALIEPIPAGAVYNF